MLNSVAFDCTWSVADGDYVKMNSTITFTATATAEIDTGNTTNLKLEVTTKTGATAGTPTCDDTTAGAGANTAAGSYEFADDLKLASGKKVTMTFTPFTADVTLEVTITKGVV